MGIPTSIKTLLSGSAVEWARIEFKEGWDAFAALKTICAFANDIDNWGGGYIVLGVKEQGGRPVFPLAGLPVAQLDRIQKDMLNKCKLIQPEYLPIVEVVDYEGRKLLVVWAPGGNSRPYSSPKSMGKNNKERVYYIRKMSSTVIPSEDELRDLFTLSNNIPFDDRVNHTAELTDLNITLIQSYLREIGSSLFADSKTLDFVDLCKSLNVVGALPEYTKPKNVGLMFFSFEPDKYFPYAQIDVVEFPDGLGGDRIIEKTFKGPLHIQLRDALLYIRNNIIQERIIKLPDVAEAKRFFNYPYAAIEEALANAVYHKGYDEREPIEVRVLPDRIEIVSHPGADRSVSIEGLSTYKVFGRRYRNRRIGEFLKELHLTEGRNTGFRKIINALKQNGSPLPVFETDEGRYSFAVTIYRHPEFPEGVDGGECVGEIVGGTGPNNVPDVPNNEPDGPNNVHNVYETGPNVPNNVPNVPNNVPNVPNNGPNVPNNEPNNVHNVHNVPNNGSDVPNNEPNNVIDKRITVIVDLIKNDQNITLSRLSEILNVNSKTIKRDIHKLKVEGIVEHIGPTHGGYWRVKTDNVFIHKQGVQQ